ncbi:MAG: hypothetical protein IT462_05645 [Planctomycetes bacterium]|nr:hypothetical protein [Planctomycetota bacterium]
MVNDAGNPSDPNSDDLVTDEYEVLESNPKIPATSVKPTDPVRPAAASRPVFPAGSPVHRTTKQVRPTASSRRVPTAPVVDESGEEIPQDQPDPRQKGKITAQKAKMIWIACIAISVLAIAAFVCDVAFDAFGRRAGGQPQQNTSQNKAPIQPKKPDKPKSAKEINVDLFVRSISDLRVHVRDTKAYDFYMLAYQRFKKSRDHANSVRAKDGDGPNLDKANAELVAAYWNAQYARVAYKHHFFNLLPEDVRDYPGVSMEDRDGMMALEDRFLKSPEIQRYQAAELVAEYSMTDVGRFRKDFLALASNDKIWSSKEWEMKVFGVDKKKYDAANDEKKFEQADLDYMNGPDYGPDEEPAHMKAEGGNAPKDGAKDAPPKDAPKDK